MDPADLPSDVGGEHTGSSSTEKGRGPTRLSSLFKKNDGEKLIVRFDELNQAIGPHRATLSSYIGGEARQKLALKYSGWKDVPITVKNKLWEDLTVRMYF